MQKAVVKNGRRYLAAAANRIKETSRIFKRDAGRAIVTDTLSLGDFTSKEETRELVSHPALPYQTPREHGDMLR